MPITTRPSGTVTIVKLDGVLMADRGVPEFAETVRTLVENGQLHIVVNCVEVRHTDSAGSSEIVKAYTLAQVHGGTAKLMVPKNGSCNDLFFIATLRAIFETYDDEAQAMTSFGGDKA